MVPNVKIYELVIKVGKNKLKKKKEKGKKETKTYYCFMW